MPKHKHKLEIMYKDFPQSLYILFGCVYCKGTYVVNKEMLYGAWTTGTMMSSMYHGSIIHI